MATALWLRTIRHHRIDRQAVEPCTRDNPHDALEEACRKLDISHPIWLDKNEREWEEFGQTRFLPDAFLDSVDFDRMEIEYIDPDAKKKRSKRPAQRFLTIGNQQCAMSNSAPKASGGRPQTSFVFFARWKLFTPPVRKISRLLKLNKSTI